MFITVERNFSFNKSRNSLGLVAAYLVETASFSLGIVYVCCTLVGRCMVYVVKGIEGLG